MIKLNILNLERFLETVNRCTGRVLIIRPDGEKADINKQYDVQRELWEEYRERAEYLPLTLKIEDPSDYMRIVSCYAGDC